MSNEFIFVVSLFVSGFILCQLFNREIPFWFLLASSFFIGCINWVITSLFVLVFVGRADPFITILVLFIEIVGILIYIFYAKKSFIYSKNNLLFFIGYLLIFSTLEFFFATNNITNASFDTLSYIFMGKELSANGLLGTYTENPASIGFFISLLQSPADFLGIDYLHTIQPILTVCIILFFFIAINFDFAKKYGWIKVNLLSCSFIALLFSSRIMQFQFSFIHSNLTCGCMLFLAFYSLYHFIESGRNKAWIFLFLIFLIGFSLARVESVLVSIIFILLLLKYYQFNYRERVFYLIPYLGFVLFIEIILLVVNIITNQSSMVNNSEIAVITSGIIVMIIFVIFSNNSFIENYILPNTPIIITIFYAAAGLFAFTTKFSHMISSLEANITAAFVTGGWGVTWFVIILLLCFFLKKSNTPFLSFCKVSIPYYYLTTFLIVYLRPPYHNRWNDSQNRIFTQILFICLIYLLISVMNMLGSSSHETTTVDKSHLLENSMG